MSTKVTGLTASNVKALALIAEALGADVRLTGYSLTSTTFTYPGTPAEAIAWLDKGRQTLIAGGYSANRHPARSLAAVRRKLAQQ